MKKFNSIFTDDLSTCYITSRTDHVEVHHVFEGRQGFKKLAEKYGFLVPLAAEIHGHGAFSPARYNWKDLDHYLKRMCQEYYLKNIGTRDGWYMEFGKFYDDRTDEKVWLNEDLK